MTTLDNPNSAANEASVPFFPTALKYGAIGGLTLVLYSLLMNLLGMGVPSSIGSMILHFIVGFGIYVLIAVLAIKQHRNNELGNYISFGRAFLVGFIALVVASIISTIFQLVYITVIDPGFVDAAMENMEKMFASFGMQDEQIQTALQEARKGFTPGKIAMQGLVWNNFINAVFALIVAAIMKRKPEL